MYADLGWLYKVVMLPNKKITVLTFIIIKLKHLEQAQMQVWD